MGSFPYMAPRTVTAVIGDVDASETPTRSIFVAPCDCVIEGVGLVCGSAVALHTTNSANVAVTKGTATLASLSTKIGEANANAIATDTYEPLTLASTESLLELEAGDVLNVTFTETTATAGDLTRASMIVRWVPGQGPGQ